MIHLRLLCPLFLTGLVCGAEPSALPKVRAALADEQPAVAQREVRQAFHMATGPERAAIMAAVGDAHPAWAGDFASDALEDAEPAVRATAISTLNRAWPTNLDDAERIRRCLADRDPLVVQAAAGFAARVGDDGALPTLVDRLDADRTGSIRKAIEALAKPAGPMPQDATGWRDVLRARDQRLAPLAESLRKAIHTGDMAAAHESVANLLLLRDQRVAVGKLLSEAMHAGNPALAKVAREGLGLLGGPVAATLNTTTDPGAQPTASPVTASAGTSNASPAAAAPATARTWDPVGLIIGGVIVAMVGGMGWMLMQVKPVKAATVRIARAASERIIKPMAYVTRRMTRPAKQKIKSITNRIIRPRPPAP